FRTEKLSLTTPMVLRNSGRVGSCRFNESLRVSQMIRRLLFVFILLIQLGMGEKYRLSTINVYTQDNIAT
ncbi:hypothetical protein, partial [uncultured Phocaeicola sp.]|uniref:hypothetical protein n=1 Tax=uncultured Phocaeicola sp. TaxID=990718 RepID=UPI0025A1254E